MDITIWHDPKDLKSSCDETDVICNGRNGNIRRGVSKALGHFVIKCYQITGTQISNDILKKKVYNSATILHSLRHENIVSIYGVTSWDQCYAVITPYMPGGSLNCLLRREVVDGLKLRIARDISAGIVYLHSIKKSNGQIVTHGSIKPSNILLGPNLRAMITDFDAAQIATCTGHRSDETDLGSLPTNAIVYSAPERITHIFSLYKPHMDVYSFGTILYELILQRAPYYNIDQAGISQYIIHNSPDMTPFDNLREQNEILQCLVDEMKKCITRDGERPSIVDVHDNLDEVNHNQNHLEIAIKAHDLMVSLKMYDVPYNTTTERTSIQKFVFPFRSIPRD
uniref:wall-associated receptor kinase-like 5 n=1 Tax=Ciona intestinalis TaxID=7719 RepID=UPI000EF45659|nr:wall-associated receptor kinase-like 5 [Ciona intestinalis]XP_026692963.1 wall-associated receptor kinase-like 5 [Ciona intestinalis]|eukprot:XP_004226786.2 wall-associated receptor kinase-like 5 [Ciona intestinalis]